jgi:hypothetical protein
MSTDIKMTHPSRGRALLIVGIALVVIGGVMAVFFGWGTPGPNTAAVHATWETVLTVGSAFAIGVGVLLILIAVVKRTRLKRAGRNRNTSGTNTSGTNTSEHTERDER